MQYYALRHDREKDIAEYGITRGICRYQVILSAESERKGIVVVMKKRIGKIGRKIKALSRLGYLVNIILVFVVDVDRHIVHFELPERGNKKLLQIYIYNKQVFLRKIANSAYYNRQNLSSFSVFDHPGGEQNAIALGGVKAEIAEIRRVKIVIYTFVLKICIDSETSVVGVNRIACFVEYIYFLCKRK